MVESQYLLREKFDKIWKRVLSKSNTCACNPDTEQFNLDMEHDHKKFASPKQQAELLVDKCHNPRKINLRALRKILEEELHHVR